jgi:hypothetical protein
MLDNVETVTKSRFFEDPQPIASPVEMFLVRDGRPGEPFADLSAREKLQVLDYYTDWAGFEERGVTFEQVDQVFLNVINGKPRDQWLDGTCLTLEEPPAWDDRGLDHRPAEKKDGHGNRKRPPARHHAGRNSPRHPGNQKGGCKCRLHKRFSVLRQRC